MKQINIESAWRLVKLGAKKAMMVEMEFHSLDEKKGYRILEVHPENIIIKRIKENTIANLRKNKVEEAIKLINDAGGRFMKRHLISPVAAETTLVLFHPKLNWSEDKKFIEAL